MRHNRMNRTRLLLLLPLLNLIHFNSIPFAFGYVYGYPRHDVLEFLLNEASECIALLDSEQHALLETSCFTPLF